MSMSKQSEEKLMTSPPHNHEIKDSGFTLEKIAEVWQLLPIQEMIPAMAQVMNGNHSRLSLARAGEIASTILEGERNRVYMLGNSYWPRFYESPLRFLKQRRLIGNDLTAVELGPSLGIHLAVMDKADRPRKMIGIDNQSHIVVAANLAMQALQRTNGLDDQIIILHGDHLTTIEKMDVAILSLVSQYEIGEAGALKWLMQHGTWGINGDLAHSRIPISLEEFKSGILPVRSKRYPNLDTGIYWSLDEEPIHYADSEFDFYVAHAHLALNPKLIGPGKPIVHMPMPGDFLKSKVTIYQDDRGHWGYEGWAFNPCAGAAPEQIKEILALKHTLEDVYQYLEIVTDGQQKWDGNAALTLPAYAAEQGCYSAVMLTTLNDARSISSTSGRLVLSIIMRHRQEIQRLFQHNMLSKVGPGKQFENLQQLYTVVKKWLAPDSGLDEIVEFCHPVLSTTIITADEELFASLIRNGNSA